MVAVPNPSPLATDIRAEAERLAAAIAANGLPLRLMGGLAIWLRCPTVRQPRFARDYGDLDFVAAASARRRVPDFFSANGYVPERLFNALHGATRLNFFAPDGRWVVDVVFDELHMSHRIDLRGRLQLPGATLDLADLLLTKLQIWEINSKDLRDIAALLADHALGDGDEGIDPRRIVALTAADWGLCHTIERNLRQVEELWRAESFAGTPFDPAAQATRLLKAIAQAPKSLAWRTRARVGERVRWYETPEEVRH